MNRKTVAQNLTRLVSQSNLSRRQLAKAVGLNDKTLWRWMQQGVGRTNGENGEKLEALCQMLGVPVDVLSCPQMSQADICAEKVREMVRIWEQIGVPFDWIYKWHCAAVAVQKLRETRPEIWQQVRRIKEFPSDAHAQAELEQRARTWIEEKGVDADALYQSLFRWAALLSEG